MRDFFAVVGFLWAALTSALLVGAWTHRAVRARRERKAAEGHAETNTTILFDPENGYRAVCFACSVAIGDWRGDKGGFTPLEALAAAQAERDFHLWSTH